MPTFFKKSIHTKALLAPSVFSLLTACSIEINTDDKKDNERNVIENIPPIATVETRLTDSEQQKFTTEEDEKVPMVLEGNSTPDTLKAYLTQAFYQVDKHSHQSRVGVPEAEVAMTMDMAAGDMASSGNAVAKSASAASGGSNDGGAASSGEFSGTNVQVEGVDEGDIWKYDGTHFFVLSKAKYQYHYEVTEEKEVTSEEGETEGETTSDGETDAPVLLASEPRVDESMIYCPGGCNPPKMISAKLRIVTNQKNTLSTTDLGDLKADEVYLTDKLLAIVGNQQSSGGDWGFYGGWRNGGVAINTFNIADLKAPVKELSIKIDGHKVRSRRIGNDLYVVSRFTPQIDNLIYYPYEQKHLEENKAIIDAMPVEELLPSITINETKGLLVKPEQCWLTVMPKNNWGSPTLTVVTKLSLETGYYESTCVGGPIEGIYMSQHALYLYNTSYVSYKQSPEMADAIIWDWSAGNTHIHKFSLNDLAYKGSQLVDGQVGYSHASFRFGELNDGSLGIVTTANEWQKPIHRLTVLGEGDLGLMVKAILPNKENPAVIGKPGERIYSVRFMQDRAYIVTFQKTDPLYVIDLSEPLLPKIA
ncbi:MAG: beta-propeller domain-containing protein, partial [Cellvibrionales bacterium]|nr:beta-propeller domain-containing protein [Cellvibrionales bacterium]